MSLTWAVKMGWHLVRGDFGYNQLRRLSGWRDNGKLGTAGFREPGDFDCTSGTAAAYVQGNVIPPEVLRGTIYSGNFGPALGRTGMVDRIDVTGLTLAQIIAKARPGDSIYGPGHGMLCIGPNQWMSFETDERGRSTGGKLGRQRGEGVHVRSLYPRGASSRAKADSKTGWSELVRPKSPATFEGQAIAALAKGKDWKPATVRLARVAQKFEAQRFAWFLGVWERWNRGMELTFDAATLAVPQQDHAFVVLGGSIEQMQNRLTAGLPAILANPTSKVLVTGAKDRDGKTEAAWMRDWLLAHGVDDSHIIVEPTATSTVWNALKSVPLLASAGITSYTVVSDASHVRRASIEFLAARVKHEIATGKKLRLSTAGLIAHDDYHPDPVKTTGPIDATSRANTAAEVAGLLGLSNQYKNAL